MALVTRQILEDYSYLSQYPNIDIPRIGYKEELLELLVVTVRDNGYLAPLEISVNVLKNNEEYIGYIPCLYSRHFPVITTTTITKVMYPRVMVNKRYSHIGIVIADKEQKVVAAGVINLVELKNLLRLNEEDITSYTGANTNMGYLKDTLLCQPKLFYSIYAGKMCFIADTQQNIGLIPGYIYDYYIPRLKIKGQINVIGKTMIMLVPRRDSICFVEDLYIIIVNRWGSVMIGTKIILERK